MKCCSVAALQALVTLTLVSFYKVPVDTIHIIHVCDVGVFLKFDRNAPVPTPRNAHVLTPSPSGLLDPHTEASWVTFLGPLAFGVLCVPSSAKENLLSSGSRKKCQ